MGRIQHTREYTQLVGTNARRRGTDVRGRGTRECDERKEWASAKTIANATNQLKKRYSAIYTTVQTEYGIQELVSSVLRPVDINTLES